MFAIQTQVCSSLPVARPPEPGAPPRPAETEHPFAKCMKGDRELDTAASEPAQPQDCTTSDCSQGAPLSADIDEHGVTPAAGQDWLANGSGGRTRRKQAAPMHVVPRPDNRAERPLGPQEDANMGEAFGKGESDSETTL